MQERVFLKQLSGNAIINIQRIYEIYFDPAKLLGFWKLGMLQSKNNKLNSRFVMMMGFIYRESQKMEGNPVARGPASMTPTAVVRHTHNVSASIRDSGGFVTGQGEEEGSGGCNENYQTDLLKEELDTKNRLILSQKMIIAKHDEKLQMERTRTSAAEEEKKSAEQNLNEALKETEWTMSKIAAVKYRETKLAEKVAELEKQVDVLKTTLMVAQATRETALQRIAELEAAPRAQELVDDLKAQIAQKNAELEAERRNAENASLLAERLLAERQKAELQAEHRNAERQKVKTEKFEGASQTPEQKQALLGKRRMVDITNTLQQQIKTLRQRSQEAEAREKALLEDAEVLTQEVVSLVEQCEMQQTSLNYYRVKETVKPPAAKEPWTPQQSAGINQDAEWTIFR